MQSFDTDNHTQKHSSEAAPTITAGYLADFPPGSRKTVELSDGRELALYNIDGELYAIENSCPHKGAPLVEGNLCNYIIECDSHGWQFDVRTGECLTVSDLLPVYRVTVQDGLIKIEI
jgi:3-phenylpropionate/trans-cinnamate dioxygenase ferredoxin component